MVILPRQARDKHRENSINDVFLQARNAHTTTSEQPGPARTTSMLSTQAVRNRVFLRHLYIKMIILPRQARDKHRESTQKRTRFLQGSRTPLSDTLPKRQLGWGEAFRPPRHRIRSLEYYHGCCRRQCDLRYRRGGSNSAVHLRVVPLGDGRRAEGDPALRWQLLHCGTVAPDG